jgi:hypothetical protein
LAKHVCGTCQFFQTAKQRDKLGWCTNPLRQDSTDVRILVRAGELRCRNDWGSDLWREKGSVDKVLDVVVNETPGADHKRPRDNTDQLVAVARPTVTAAPLVGLDSSSASATPEAEARRVSGDLNSELLRRARQQFRDRQQSRGYAVEPTHAVQQPQRDAIVISNDYVPPSGHETPPESPIRFAERSVPDASFYEVPEVAAEDDVPYRARSEARPTRRTDDDDFPAIRSLGEPDPERASNEPARTDARPDIGDQNPFAELENFAGDRSEPEPSRYVLETRANERWSDPEPLIISDEYDRAGLAEAESFDNWSEAAEDELPPPFSLWSAIPVCCQTCRDFRPAGEGGRGWCTNKWAFKHRRMVDADECPCETSIGNWWIPADSAWQGELDVSTLGEPTPLMDKYFGRPGADPGEHFVERRRRRS